MMPPIVKINSPLIMTIFRPIMSASLPTGSIIAATTTRYEIKTHWTVGMSEEKCSAISGIITFEEPRSTAVQKMERAPERKASHL